MSRVSNRFYVTAIADGSTISAVLRSDKTLAQVYNPQSGSCVPDWTDSDYQPTLYGHIRVNGTEKAPVSSSVVWYYNNNVLEFDEETNISTGDAYGGLFEKTTVAVGGKTMPALKIIDNLASVDNTDNDVITLTGDIEIGGTNISFTVNAAVRLTEQSSSGYFGYIEGDSFVDTPTAVATMTAYLNNGTSAVTSFRTKWVREEGNTTGWPKEVATTTGSASTTISASEITDYSVIRIDFYEYNDTEYANKVYSAYWDVDDTQDMEEMYISHGSENQNNASLRSSESVTFKIWMARRTDQTAVMTDYQTFKCKLIDSEGNTITSGLPSGWSPDSDGYSDITQTSLVINENLTVAYGGAATISYDFAHNNGDTITGVIVATTETTE